MYLKLEQRSVNCPVKNSNEPQGYSSLCTPRRAPSGDVNFVFFVVAAAAAADHTFGFQCHSMSQPHVQSHVSWNQQIASLCCITRDIKYESIFWYLTMEFED